MNYYLIIGVERSPHSPNDDGDSYDAFKVAVSSEKELTFEELEKAFEEEVEILWGLIFDDLELEEQKDWEWGEGYKHAEYVLVSSEPFPEDVDIYGVDLANDYLGY